jgi:hypothetical protein
VSRSGYHDDLDVLDLGRWRGQVASARRGKRGQKFLIDLLAALDAMPNKRLITGDLENEEGDVCAIGSLGKARALDMSKIDPTEPDEVSAAFDIAACLAQEVVYFNDECYNGSDFDPETRSYTPMTPEKRWVKMRAWVAKQLASPSTSGANE